MNLFPLSVFIFSLISGTNDMGGQATDVKGEIVSHYKELQIEEVIEDIHQEIEPIESKEELT